MNEMKQLNVTVIFKQVGQSSILVPRELSLNEAIEYAKAHISEIPTPMNAEYVCDSDLLDDENCDIEFLDNEELESDSSWFEYNGYHFKPHMQLTPKELEFNTVSRRLSSDADMKLSNYDWGDGYSYNDFYKAAGEKIYDLFMCWENSKVYIPGVNELFIYRGNT